MALLVLSPSCSLICYSKEGDGNFAAIVFFFSFLIAKKAMGALSFPILVLLQQSKTAITFLFSVLM